MRMAKRRIARRVGFEKCLIPWKELMDIYNHVPNVSYVQKNSSVTYNNNYTITVSPYNHHIIYTPLYSRYTNKYIW